MTGNRRYYGRHRINKREQTALNVLYAPSLPTATTSRRFRENERNAFSHSIECDTFFSVINKEPGGILHTSCKCWCHGAANFRASAEPEYDFTPPPEYINSADLAFTGEQVDVGTTHSMLDLNQTAAGPGSSVFNDFAPEWEPDSSDFNTQPTPSEASATQFPNRSRRELSVNKCDTCGDTLTACECVE